MSIKPGVTVFPAASMTVPACAADRSPMAAIFPSVMPTSARRAELLTQVRELLSELRYLGVSQQELLNLVKEASPS